MIHLALSPAQYRLLFEVVIFADAVEQRMAVRTQLRDLIRDIRSQADVSAPSYDHAVINHDSH